MFARSTLLSFVATVVVLPLVSAHGSLNFAIIDGTNIPGPNPNGDSGQFAIRAINDIDPVKGATNPDLTCGHGATTPAALVADANPGSTIQFSWRNGEGGPWVHNTGPVMTYMAPCGPSGCANFSTSDAAQASFFKIGELGRKDDLDWYMSDLNAGSNATTNVTLPTDLPAGEYLVRHELIALQLAMSPGGAEFYPACLQIRLAAPQGTAAPLPSGNSVATFPGAYTDQDPGILDTDVYDNKSAPYVFPGPPLLDAATTTPLPDPSSTDPSSDPSPTAPSPDIIPSSTNSSIIATPTGNNNGCGGGGGSRKKKRTVVKRIVRQAGPLIKKRSTTLVERDAVVVMGKRDAVIPNAHRIRADHPNNIVRSRVMRGVF